MAVKKSTEAADGSAIEQINHQKAEEPASGFCVYIGPSITGVIQRNTIYPCGKDAAELRDDVKLATSRYPEIASLIVDGNDLPTAIEKIKTRGEDLWKRARHLAKNK